MKRGGIIVLCETSDDSFTFFAKAMLVGAIAGLALGYALVRWWP